MIKTENAAQLLALSALAGVILAPPEAFGSGRMILVVGSTFAFLLLILEGQVEARYLRGGLVGMVVLVAHSLWISIDFYRSLEFVGIVWAYYCLFGYLVYSRMNSLHRVAGTLVALAGVVSIYGIYQFFWGIDAMYGLVFYSGAPEPVRVPMLDQLATGRIFSTFALPGTLWGYLLLSLPLHGILWKPGRRFGNSLLIVSAVLLLATGALTRSYGFALGLLVLVLGWLFTRPGARPWRSAAAVTLLMTVLAGGIFLIRSETHNPVSLRLQNWMTGWEMFASYPLGVGLNGYAVAYLGHQQPGANETQFAHNTPVQFLSEMGWVAFAAMAALAIYVTGRRKILFDTTGPPSLSAPRSAGLDGSQSDRDQHLLRQRGRGGSGADRFAGGSVPACRPDGPWVSDGSETDPDHRPGGHGRRSVVWDHLRVGRAAASGED